MLFIAIHGEGYVYTIPRGIACDISDCEGVKTLIGKECNEYC